MITTESISSLLAFDGGAFGATLTQASEISDTDWRLAEQVSRQNAQTSLRALLDLGLLSEDALADQLASFTGCPRWDPEDEQRLISDAVPRQFMESNALLLLSPIDAEDSEAPSLLICSDPSDRPVLRAMVNQLDRAVDVAIGAQKDIKRFLEANAEEIEGAAAGAEDQLDISEEISQLRDMASEAPVIRFFNQTIERAMELGASDVHIERFDHRAAIRLRVDGLLIDQPAPPPQMYDPLICRVKIMSGLDIAERRLPQDGRIRMRLRGRMVDMRVSLVPTMYGQDAAIRLQDRQKLGEIDLPDLGFTDEQIGDLLACSSKSHGIVLVTGPTGSGKTTTLYALLRRLVSSERKVVTVEDPVEYAMEGVNQIQVNPAIGLSFSNTLRHILRHDPDVILIGEIRDQETAEMAFQAALTGHMVLSTLHTNDVPGTFVRLIDMGVEPYLVNAVIEGVTAQRLIRRTCPACGNDPAKREGCRTCGGIGYRGRAALMEFASLDAKVKKEIRDGADERRVREALAEGSYVPMRAAAERMVSEGMTDMAEVARVLGHVDPEAPGA